MVGNRKMNQRILSLLGNKNMKKRTIIIALKSDNTSREMLLRLLHFIVVPGDTVLALHVQEPDDTFDPNTFHIHEDLCKSKQVDFQVKIATQGKSYLTELSHQVRVNFATILAMGCSSPWPNDSIVSRFLKALPPTCTLLVMDNGGKILLQREGTSQQGSTTNITTSTSNTSNRVYYSSMSALSPPNGTHKSETKHHIRKSLTMPCCSTSSSLQQDEVKKHPSFKNNFPHTDVMSRKVFQKLAALDIKGCSRRFTLESLKRATDNFSPRNLIAEGGQSMVYRANLDDGQVAAVKLYKLSQNHQEDLFREVEILSGLEHENIVKLLGYCYSKEINAVIYTLLEGSLNSKLTQLKWSQRMRIAVDLAKSLDYLHSCSPPIIHRDVKSSNILLSDNFQARLSDFGLAHVHEEIQQSPSSVKQRQVVGTFGYLAPEYMMYGKVDEKIDVYSYGVVLLELITGKEAIQSKSTTNHESLVLWARSLLCSGLCERLIDPKLGRDYDKNEVKILMIAARLCLLHSSSRRPTMKQILGLYENPAHWLETQRKREELIERIGSRGEAAAAAAGGSSSTESESYETIVIDES